MRQRFLGSRWWKRKLAMYSEVNKRVEIERQKKEESGYKERMQQQISEELKNENIEMEIKKRRKKKQR
jgi:2C-methyl-D-erythritol 2,4-cyclodiphosphate synthase